MKHLITFTTLFFISFASANQENQIHENDYAVYHFAISDNYPLKESKQIHQVSSDEYSFQISGVQLNKGVPIVTTQSAAIILINPVNQHTGQISSQKLDHGLLSLYSLENKGKSAISKTVSQNQLAQTGVFDGSIAIFTHKEVDPGKLELTSTQPLLISDVYRITIKEKGSPYTLNMKIKGQSHKQTDQIIATASLVNTQSKSEFQLNSLSAGLIAPDGRHFPVAMQPLPSGEFQLKVTPPDNVISPNGGLYEVHVKTDAKLERLNVRRDAKLAFALTRNTAELTQVTFNQTTLTAQIEFNAHLASRYEIRALLHGTDAQGNLVPIMESHAAQTVNSGKETLEIAFDPGDLSRSGTKGPYKLSNIRLYDQQQVGLIDTLKEKAM